MRVAFVFLLGLLAAAVVYLFVLLFRRPSLVRELGPNERYVRGDEWVPYNEYAPLFRA